MDKPKITICTVNFNSSQFIELMLFAIEKLTHNSYKVIIRDNNSKLSDYKKLKKIVGKYNRVSLYRVETDLKGSIAHGEALNDLVSKIDTEYGVILDADATFLVKDWDDILINKLSESIPIFGTQADDSGKKPMDFPLMFALIFKTDTLKKIDIDFRPKNINLGQDTGFELREKYQKADLSGGLLYGFNTREYKNGPFANVVCTEYYLSKDGNGEIFATHFGRGSSPKAKRLVRFTRSTNIFIRIINRLIRPFNTNLWKTEKKHWIKTVKEIIEKQNA
jgi:hypothetical protein